jgi:hypothetical protein
MNNGSAISICAINYQLQAIRWFEYFLSAKMSALTVNREALRNFRLEKAIE